MSHYLKLSVAFIAVWAIALFAQNETLVSMLLINASIQVILFAFVACIPFLQTGRMSFVDLAWPFGVAAIGLMIITVGDGDILRRTVAGLAYLFIGLRMGIGGLYAATKTGIIFRREFPRYKYRRLKLEESGNGNIEIHMLVEIMVQGLANTSVLALPGFLLATNGNSVFSAWEVIGITILITAYLLETVADRQKTRFVSNDKKGVCNVGLWRYSRHPNYFSEWLVWTGLVISAVSSWLLLLPSEQTLVWITLGLGTVGASMMMYLTLVFLTGAIPAEYYSVRKRPGYKHYQETTSMFFPWAPKKCE
ncbi:DUF1295 domain-containing protein [Congregibacter brevis]|uniref:DUF1295 domain-containing protein n=1 Tax=Congregibacter brevis TaxID=3081201 RepID=A0ABZ0IF37_9GAMM|nr:DUF1295 domain-containing protein [Congregibacter sp. IMCC45268]